MYINVHVAKAKRLWPLGTCSHSGLLGLTFEEQSINIKNFTRGVKMILNLRGAGTISCIYLLLNFYSYCMF